MSFENYFITLKAPIIMKTVNHIRFILILLVIFSFSKGAYGQARDTCKIYFAQNSSYIVSDYLGNKESVAKLKTMLANTNRIDTVYVNVASSPEGAYKLNEWLTGRRADRLLQFVIKHSDGAITLDRIKVNVIPENWEGLTAAVDKSYFGNDRELVLAILRNEGISNDQKEAEIKNLDGGTLWSYFIKEYMPALRFADEIVLLRRIEMPVFTPSLVKEVAVQTEFKPAGIKHSYTPVLQESAPAVSALAENTQNQFLFSIRTNLLYDLSMIPNLGLEFHLGKRFSLGANYAHAWWSNDPAHQYWRIYGGDVVFRKYFGGKENWSSLSGHHLGAYGQCYSYDFELGARGQLSELTYGGGLEYGYTVPLSKALSLDFNLGCAYLTGEYKVYEPEDDCYVWKETRQRHYIGPTKAEFSLVWLFGKGKGGRR